MHAAAIAFYAVVSLAPMVLLLAALLSVFGAIDAVLAVAERLGGGTGAHLLHGSVALLSGARQGVPMTVFSALVLVYFSSKVFRQLHRSLTMIFGVPAAPRWRDHVFGMLMVVALLVLALPVVLGGMLVSSLRIFVRELPLGGPVAQVLGLIASLVLLTGFCALLFRFGSQARPSWPAVWLGALTAALLISCGNVLVGVLLGQSLLVNPYTASGAVLFVLLWSFYAAQLFLFGAEVVSVATELSAS